MPSDQSRGLIGRDLYNSIVNGAVGYYATSSSSRPALHHGGSINPGDCEHSMEFSKIKNKEDEKME